MDNLKRAVKPQGHFMASRSWQITIGIALFLIGALLVYDAFDGRGKKIPWPLGAITPW